MYNKYVLLSSKNKTQEHIIALNQIYCSAFYFKQGILHCGILAFASEKTEHFLTFSWHNSKRFRTIAVVT